jgi:hypothetical protein
MNECGGKLKIIVAERRILMRPGLSAQPPARASARCIELLWRILGTLVSDCGRGIE